MGTAGPDGDPTSYCITLYLIVTNFPAQKGYKGASFTPPPGGRAGDIVFLSASSMRNLGAVRAMPPDAASRVECYFDGAVPGNQFETKGRMRIAFVVGKEETVREIPDLQTADGPLRSNNIAEYQALIALLERLHEIDDRSGQRRAYLVSGDSQLIIRQMTGRYRVREPHLLPLHQEARRLAEGLSVEFRWVPREKNRAGALLE